MDPRDCWDTPRDLFAEINTDGRFTIDVCAEPWSAKMSRFWTREDDGLAKDWSNERCFVNPPYSDVEPWAEKCETARVACLLVPVSSDSKWWHRALNSAVMIDFFLRRIDFVPPASVMASSCNGRHCLMWFGDVCIEPGIRWRSRCAKTGKLL